MSEVQLVLAEAFHDDAGDKAMFFQRRCKDEDVVEINGDDTLGDKVFKDLVHHRLEGRRAVGQSEVHHQWFEQTAIRSKRRFPFIAFFYPHIVISPADVEFSKVLCALESVNEVVNGGEGIAILPSDQIKRAIVLYEAKFSVLLLDEEDRSAYWRFQVPNAARCQGFFQEGVQFPLFFGGHWIDLSEPRRRFALKFDRMIPFSAFGEVIEGALTEYVFEFV